MSDCKQKPKIKITAKGPYIVTGGVKISEKIITPVGDGYEWTDGEPIPQSEVYALCRCGKSKNPPFCDGFHVKTHFTGEETAERNKFMDRATVFEGPELDLYDDSRCAFARFCHRDSGNIWELIRGSDDPYLKEEAIKAASDCPTGRLVAADKSGNLIEPHYEPEIIIVQDPDRGCSGGIYVKGDIEIESADGELYEHRGRLVLCRCGQSENTPFCDASHVSYRYRDKKKGLLDLL